MLPATAWMNLVIEISGVPKMSTDPIRETIKIKRPAEKVKLTKRTIEALPVPAEVGGRPSKVWIYDAQTARLAMCCWSTGARSWVWVGRCHGRMMKMKLGEYPEMAPEQAKKLATKASADVANGIDPREARYKARTEMTLSELFERYLEEHAKLHKRTWKD